MVSWPLVVAGLIGIVTATIHATILQGLMVVPLVRLAGADGTIRRPARRLIAPLLHVSSWDWFVGGIALVAVGLWLDGPAQTGIGVLVAVQFGYAAALNAWATRGRHPGWMLMAASVALIVFGLVRAMW